MWKQINNYYYFAVVAATWQLQRLRVRTRRQNWEKKQLYAIFKLNSASTLGHKLSSAVVLRNVFGARTQSEH